MGILMVFGDFTREGHRNLGFFLALIGGLVIGLAVQASAIARYDRDLTRKDEEIARQAKYIHQLQAFKKPKSSR